MRKWDLLRKELDYRGILQKDVEVHLGKKHNYVSDRYTGKRPWTLEEMYMLMDMIDADYSQMHRYFPRNGFNKQADFPYMRKVHDRNALFGAMG